MSNLLNRKQNFVRPDYTKPYKIGETSRKFFSWINIHVAKEQHKTPRMHYQMIDELIETAKMVKNMIV